MADFIIDNSEQSSGRPRKGWVAAILSLVMIGLGQMYNGQLRKGVIFYLLGFAAPGLLFLASGRPIRPLSVALPIAFVLSIQIASVIDAWRHARSIGNHFRPARYNRFSIYLTTYLVFGLLFSGFSSNYIRDNHVQAYKIPAGSMEPALLIGDHILVDKSVESYGRGDLVVFEFPGDEGKGNPRDFIKRIVGLPGEVIEVWDKQLYINGRQLEEPYAVHREATLVPADVAPRDNFGPITVPADSYFTLGDNRDRSYDSRFWGVVKGEKLRGRSVTIYWSWVRETSRVRWERLGREIVAGEDLWN